MHLRQEDNLDNPLMLQFFTWDVKHESLSWWKHFEREVPGLSEMGFTQVWLPPPNKAAHQDGRGYDAYDLWDLGEFDQKGSIATRWGTREEYLRACDVAKQCGVDVIIDAVLNHKMGGDHIETFPAVPVNPDNRLEDIGSPRLIDGWTAFDFPGRNGKYSTFRWNYEHFSGVGWDEKTQSEGIFRIQGPVYKTWSKHVDRELGNYDYLMGLDINHRNPEVRDELIQWGEWILKTTGAVGFRLDAVKHIDQPFLLNFLRTIRTSHKHSRLFAVAEYWSGDLKAILPYIKAFKGETAFFDVPLHMNFYHASVHRSRFDLRTILNDTVMKVKPKDAVTFVDNHDTVEGQTLQSWVGDNFKVQAYALILLRAEGYPCVFYGDLYPNSECYSETIAQNLCRLIEARKRFAYGSTRDYYNSKNCIGFVRTGDISHPGSGCAVLISNKNDTGSFVHTVRMFVGKDRGGLKYRSFMSEGGSVEIGADGWGDFTCFPNYIQVWVLSS